MVMAKKKEGGNFRDEFFNTIAEEYTSFASEGESCSEFSGWIDTGCYILNGMVSGSLYGGIPNNKITALCGESGVGKTYIALGVMKNFLDSDPEALVIYYDTEAAVTRQMMENRKIDTNRVILHELDTVQKFRTHCLKVLDTYIGRKNKPPIMIVLDSLGMLSSSKEMADSTEGKDTRDMTRAQIIKGVFRTITLRLGKCRVPFLLTNHTYLSQGQQYPTTEISGGSGLKYAASSIIVLKKAKDKEGKEVVGVILKARNEKARISRQYTEINMKLSFETGLSKYYGLLELADKYDIIKKTGVQYQLPDGSKTYGKSINDDPEKYFTPEIMKLLEDAAKKEFLYG